MMHVLYYYCIVTIVKTTLDYETQLINSKTKYGKEEVSK